MIDSIYITSESGELIDIADNGDYCTDNKDNDTIIVL